MNTLTQVWVFCIGLCSALLVVGFKFLGRPGLIGAFLLCLGVLYLFLHRGMQLYLTQLKANKKVGNDTTGFISLIQKLESRYQFRNTATYFSGQPTQPLVWQDFHGSLSILIYPEVLNHLNDDEKKMLAHVLLAHGRSHNQLRRRFMSIVFLAMRPLSQALSFIFDFIGRGLGFRRQILSADLQAFKSMESLTFGQKQEFVLFLRKLHLLDFHQVPHSQGELFFSILSQSSHHLGQLNLVPSLNVRLNNLTGENA
jgi:hypothetical protein